MRTLLEICEDVRALERIVAEATDATGGEITPEVEKILDEWFASVQSDLVTKADGYAALIRERTLLATIRREEVERLQKLIAADENLARRLKDRLKEFMMLSGINRIDTQRYRITVHKNGGKPPLEILVSPDLLPPEYQRKAITADADKIRQALADGKSLDFARLKDAGTHLRIA